MAYSFRKGSARHRFEGFIVRSGGCWLWRGSTSFMWTLRPKRMVTPRRAAWRLFGKGLIRVGAKLFVTCGNEDCVNPKHLRTMTSMDRFLENIRKEPSGCWRWTGVIVGGYGVTKLRGKQEGAHRVSYELFTGDVLGPLSALHTCDHSWCVNPEHLYKGDQADNMLDMVERGRSTTGERNPNAILTDADVRDMRARYAAGDKPRFIHADYADRISYKQMQKVLYGEAWTHVV